MAWGDDSLPVSHRSPAPEPASIDKASATRAPMPGAIQATDLHLDAGSAPSLNTSTITARATVTVVTTATATARTI